ncbi:MAG: NAD(P)/FAD-dependent oxidoreductase [Pseudomonadota bacterium]
MRSLHPTRRGVLAGLTAASGLAVTRPAFASNPDVVIIGAGSAGLAAAHRLSEEGLTWVLLEAAGRIGGRAWTESASLGQPFDHGASWMLHANRNPFTRMAEEAGFTTYVDDAVPSQLYVGNRPATGAERRRESLAWDGMTKALSKAARLRQDVSAASLLPSDLPWIHVPEAWSGPISMGQDFDKVSVLDWWAMDDPTPNRVVKEGYGTLVARFGRDLPVSLKTAAKQVRWDGAGVEVETDRGSIRARACIVTVSTGVLGSGAIRFDPPLPLWKQEAIAGIPMGLLAKVGFGLSGSDRLGLNKDSWLSYYSETTEVCYFYCWPFGRSQMIGFLGGQLAWDLTKAGKAAAVDFALQELKALFGSEIEQRVEASVWTEWGANPLTQGAYATALPGQFKQRRALQRSVGDRLFFAGEACDVAWAQTVNGAYTTGVRSADAVARTL